jgi:mannose-6-phosphate isomerase
MDRLPRKIEKPWGFELLLAHTTKYAAKIIFVKAGHRLSLQYHRAKEESLYLYQGKALIEIEENHVLVKHAAEAGYCCHIPPSTKHRLAAIEDSTFIEVSTPELEDVERLEDDYGRVGQERAT